MVTNPNDDFDLLNTFMHDLKTPLAAVKSYLELIEHAGEFNDQQRKFADKAQNNLLRVQQIVDELLDFARMENNLSMHFETVDLKEVIYETISLLEGVADEKGVKVYADIPRNVQQLHADARMIKHVIANLIANAIKYNVRDGEIRIMAQREGDFVRVAVSDTGIGIPEDALPRVFDKFFRVDRRKGQKIEGTGLGLTIVKTIVDRHGGSIDVESQLERGTTFTFTMPLASISGVDHDREAADDIDDSMQEDREVIEDSDSRDDYLNR